MTIVRTPKAIIVHGPPVGIPGARGANGAAGQNVDSIGLLTAAAGMDTAGADLVRTSGNTEIDFGRGAYVKDSSVDLVTFPKAGFANNTGQKYRITRGEVFNPQTQYIATDPDFQAAMERSLAYLEADAVGSGFYKAGQPMHIPASHAGNYVLHDTLSIRHRLKVTGDGGQAGPSSYGPTAFTVPDGIHALVVEFPDSVGADNITGTTHNGAHNAEISGIGFFGPGSGAVSNFDTIVLRAPTDLTDIYGRGLPGILVRMWTGVVNGHDYGGDCSNSNLDRVKGEACKATLDIRGTNSNVINTKNCQGYQNLQYGMLDGNQAGANTHRNWHCTYNGIPAPSGGPFTQCSISGNLYTPNLAAIDFTDPVGTSTLLNAHAPSGTTAHTPYWLYVRPGAPTATQPAFASGGPWTYGGDYFATTPWMTAFKECYIEGGGPMSQALFRQTDWHGGSFDLTNTYGGTISQVADDGVRFQGAGAQNLRLVSGGGSSAFVAQLPDGTEFFLIQATYGGQTVYWSPSTHHIYVQSGASLIDVGYFDFFGLSLATGKVLSVDGNKVLGARGAALPADATDLATTITLANAIKARLKVTGGHGLVAD